MANVRVAINGFGRIGRLAFRQMFGAKGYEVVAINDLTSPAMLAHLLKYDSAQGRYALADKVSSTENSIIVDGKEIKIYAEKDAKDLPWGEIGVDVVLECTGFYCSKAKSQAHIDAGAKKGRHLRSCGQRSADHRLQRQREDAQADRYHHLRGFLHDQLPRADGQHAQ